MTDKETQQADIQKKLKELHDKLRRLNLPIAAYPSDKDNQATGTVGTMKINLTKLLDVSNRVIKLTDDKGTAGDTTYIKRDSTADCGTYSFMRDPDDTNSLAQAGNH